MVHLFRLRPADIRDLTTREFDLLAATIDATRREAEAERARARQQEQQNRR